jgi:hypothetical protein
MALSLTLNVHENDEEGKRGERHNQNEGGSSAYGSRKGNTSELGSPSWVQWFVISTLKERNREGKK